jgi:SNF2 family DNA or RNA helicase
VTPCGWLRDTLANVRDPQLRPGCEPGLGLAATLRPYQADGVRWLWFLTRLGLGACLADDMGLGKTIQVIDLFLRLRDDALATPHRERKKSSQAVSPRRQSLLVVPASLVGNWKQELARFALTGTPVENQLGDLWSLFDFCCPGLLGSAGEFRAIVKRMGKRADPHGFAPLRRLIQPSILRRLKTDPRIVPDLPAKTEMRSECGLSRKQAALYQQAVDDLQKQLRAFRNTGRGNDIRRRGVVLATTMRLKQICNHPAHFLKPDDEAAYAAAESGKFLRLAEICNPIAARQEKVLVFTQFQTMCGPLASWLGEVFGRPVLVLHSGVPVGRRQSLVRRFQEDDAVPFFVISVKAGGTGLNLTAASHVVHFDRWWNPAVENQATDRAFRIGQTKNVIVHAFVCRGTLEEWIDDMLRQKRDLAERLLGSADAGETLLTEMSDDELLRVVALDVSRAAVD